jgi:hypothetical protein
MLQSYTVASYFCRKKHKYGGIAIYSATNITQIKPLNWVTGKSIEKTFEVTGIELKCNKGKFIIIAIYM